MAVESQSPLLETPLSGFAFHTGMVHGNAASCLLVMHLVNTPAKRSALGSCAQRAMHVSTRILAF